MIFISEYRFTLTNAVLTWTTLTVACGWPGKTTREMMRADRPIKLGIKSRACNNKCGRKPWWLSLFFPNLLDIFYILHIILWIHIHRAREIVSRRKTERRIDDGIPCEKKYVEDLKNNESGTRLDKNAEPLELRQRVRQFTTWSE